MDGADWKTVVRKQLRVSISPLKTLEVTKKVTRERNTLTLTKNKIVGGTPDNKTGSLVAISRKE